MVTLAARMVRSREHCGYVQKPTRTYMWRRMQALTCSLLLGKSAECRLVNQTLYCHASVVSVRGKECIFSLVVAKNADAMLSHQQSKVQRGQ
jgi:hypothetical protein